MTEVFQGMWRRRRENISKTTGRIRDWLARPGKDFIIAHASAEQRR